MNQKNTQKIGISCLKRELLRGNKEELQEINQSLILLGRAIARWKLLQNAKQNN